MIRDSVITVKIGRQHQQIDERYCYSIVTVLHAVISMWWCWASVGLLLHRRAESRSITSKIRDNTAMVLESSRPRHQNGSRSRRVGKAWMVRVPKRCDSPRRWSYGCDTCNGIAKSSKVSRRTRCWSRKWEKRVDVHTDIADKLPSAES